MTQAAAIIGATPCRPSVGAAGRTRSGAECLALVCIRVSHANHAWRPHRRWCVDSVLHTMNMAAALPNAQVL
ncbi:MAG: hypothetical protein P8Y36_14925, partial [Alphaproteobacteria bacterium]